MNQFIDEKYVDWLDQYSSNGFQAVEGWVDGRLISILKFLHKFQIGLSVKGGALEVGVHHGRFFIALNGMVAPGEATSFAIDLFEDQVLNIDRSGRGCTNKFVENLKMYDRHGGSNVVSIQADSTRLRHADLSQFRICPPKVISVDGGHTVEHTISDLVFAEAIIHDKGAVILDDILNARWLGVIEGALAYLHLKPTLWPVFIGYNKLILVPMSIHALCLAQFQKFLPNGKIVKLCGYSLITP